MRLLWRECTCVEGTPLVRVDRRGAEGIYAALLHSMRIAPDRTALLSDERPRRGRLSALQRATVACVPALEVQRAPRLVGAVVLRDARVPLRPPRARAPNCRVRRRRRPVGRGCRRNAAARRDVIVANELIGAMRAEFELMCLAARTYTGPLEHARITTLVQAGVDWPRFLALVERHYVAPLVQRTLQSIGGAGVPAKVLATLRVRCLITQWKSSQLANELARLQEDVRREWNRDD